jgi:hypothetical protein
MVRALPIFIDGDDQVDKRSPRPSVTIKWLYLGAMIHFSDLIGPALHTLRVTHLHPHQQPTADRAIQCAIPILGAWGSKKETRNRQNMLQTVMDHALKPDELV